MVLLDTRTAPEDFRNPELVDCTFSMVYFSSTGDGRGLGPVIGFFWQTFELACGSKNAKHQIQHMHSRASSSAELESF